MSIRLERERVALEKFKNFPPAGKPEFPIQFTGFIETEDLVGLFGEVVFGFEEESEVGVAFKDVFEVLDAFGVGLDVFGPW